MRTIVLDIETWAPQWKDGERGWESDSFAPTAYHEPVVICWLVAESGGDMRLEVSRLDVTPEREVLIALGEDFKLAHRLVTWNGRGFDMPVLSCRALACGVDWSFWHDWRHRFPTYKQNLMHYDLQDQLGDYGAARGLRQDRVAKICGLPGKPDDIDGAMVGEEWAHGSRDKVMRYCIDDVLDLYGIYLRFVVSFRKVKIDSVAAAHQGLVELRDKVGRGEME